MSKILISGVQPSGRPHIGNYFGAMKQFVDLQGEYDSNIFIADLHALTSLQDKEKLQENIVEQVIDYLAIGLDPEQTTIFKQSDIPEVAELSWIFSCLITMPFLMRAHSFKDAEAKNKEIKVGKFIYPVLMAADILLPEADVVPVGKDQKQHVEIAREIANKFNNTFGETFKSPKELILSDVETVIGTDGQKMSKSYNNTIPLFASDEEIEKAVMSIPTDSKGVEEPKDPETNNIYQIHKLFLNQEERKETEDKYKNGGLGYKEAKENLINDLKKFIAPLREKRLEISKDRDRIIEILKTGSKKMREKVLPKMKEVEEKVGLKLY